MPKLIDETGNRYGRLKVLKRSAKQTPRRYVYWLCQCDCGNLHTVGGPHLRGGLTKSCGCYRRERIIESTIKPRGHSARNKLLRVYKWSANDRGLSWQLTREEFNTLTSSRCYYCGIGPQQVIRIPKGNGDYIYNGIDRVDNSKGYTLKNCVSCCSLCNFSKRDLTVEEFKEWIIRVYNHLIREEEV